MKKSVLVAALVVAVAAALATQAPAGQTYPAKPAEKTQPAPKPAEKAQPAPKPAEKAPAERPQGVGRRPGAPPGVTMPAPPIGTAPQPATSGEPSAPTGEMSLGSVRLTRRVMADGKALSAGTYQVFLTAQEAQPAVVGQTEKLERWVEFRQGKDTKGREVVSIVPENEIKGVAYDTPPRAGGSKVEMLRGNDYVRVWINRGGNHFLIHLPPA